MPKSSDLKETRGNIISIVVRSSPFFGGIGWQRELKVFSGDPHGMGA